MKRKKKITVETKADRKLILWGLFFKKLLQNLEASVVVTDVKGRTVFVNKMYIDHFGFSEKEIVGHKWVETIIPEDKINSVEKIFNRIKSKKVLTRFDAPAQTKDKGNECIRWTCIPLKEKQICFYMFIGIEVKNKNRNAVKCHVVSSRNKDKTYKEIVDMLYNASLVSEPETAVHAARVMLFAVILAKRLKLSKTRIERLKAAALLHDLGKLAVDEKILFKKGKLNKEEFEEIKKHPGWGSSAINLVYFLQNIIPIMISHHENYDGTGYPNGIKGSQIPMEARILSVADIFEALTADRSYRKGFSPERALAMMEEEKGTKLDPEITDVFFDIVKRGKIQKEYF